MYFLSFKIINCEAKELQFLGAISTVNFQFKHCLLELWNLLEIEMHVHKTWIFSALLQN
mgnify:CR=1 FL=1